MRTICWLHISDFHLNEKQSKPQQAVLTAMLDDIKRRCGDGSTFDFILATGDLAFSGKEVEYNRVNTFFNDLSVAAGVPRDKIFCVPGNHDVDRERQKSCFTGARYMLQNQTAVYSFIADAEERETLLMRQKNFRQFQENFFSGQQREQTDDGLGYVSVIEVEDIRIAIIGLNSAWLAEGGRADEGQLLLGEQQVASAIEISKKATPHIAIGMAHHPFHLLRDFDQGPNRRRIEEACHFFHCGHLHESNASSVVSHAGRCLTLTAGASFESRETHNAYTAVRFDPLRARTEVTFVQYDPRQGVFSNESNRLYPHEINAVVSCTVGELAGAIERYCPSVANISHYLAALLLGGMSEVPIPGDQACAFGSVALLQKQPEDEFTVATENLLAVGNAIKLLHGRKSLDEILVANGGPIATYGEQLDAACKINNDLQAELAARETNARKLVDRGAVSGTFQHTLMLLDELRAADEWDTLREQAERSCDLADPTAAAKVKRLWALSLARSTERADHRRAINLYRELATSQGEAEDWANLTMLLVNEGDYAQAKATVLEAIEAFPQNIDGFVQIGMKIVAETGDVPFRELLSAYRARKGTA